jgi:hypothetical protein
MKRNTVDTQAQRLGLVSLAISMPMFDAARIQRTMETAWQMACQGLKQR